MLFDIDNVIESEKERNLYYKFFAGYFFNELVNGWKERLKQFVDAINVHDRINENPKILKKIPYLSGKTHISFDNHAYLAFPDRKNNRGEFADILLYDKIKSILVAVEVKYLSKLSYKKDVENNWKRINSVKEELKIKNIVYCILIRKKYWEDLIEVAKDNGFYKRCKREAPTEMRILFWEDFLNKNEQNGANKYLCSQLKHTKPWYFSSSDGIIDRIKLDI